MTSNTLFKLGTLLCTHLTKCSCLSFERFPHSNYKNYEGIQVKIETTH